jgi:ABC-2 type transport system permease protein
LRQPQSDGFVPGAALRAATYRSFSLRRVGAMVLRHWYLLRYSWPRVLDLVYWPAVQMLMWGFLQSYLISQAGLAAQAGGALIGAVLLWDILFRGQIGFSVSFLEEMWSRNLGNLLMTPLRPAELVASLMAMSIIRVMIGLVPVTFLAILFFGFNLWGLGLAVAAFFGNLILTSWAIGLVSSGLVLKKGLGAESLAWSLTFLLLPLACVYYPVATLPSWLQWLALSLPPTHVFEGLRGLLLRAEFDSGAMFTALALNAVYLTAACAFFAYLLRSARRSGSLMQTGE